MEESRQPCFIDVIKSCRLIYAVYTLVIMYAAKMAAHLLTVIHSLELLVTKHQLYESVISLIV